jgi:hypothetical protein
MADSTWLSYVGVVTGLIGAITGVAVATMGFISYRRSGQMKAQDMRVELRKATNDLRTTVQNLIPLLESAKRSHTNIAAATGLGGSGAVTGRQYGAKTGSA